MGAFFYNVEPRYTAGSPASVDRVTADRVAKEERLSIKHALSGAWGPAEKARAEAEGLDLIVFSMKEVSRGWLVEDMITGRQQFWPFSANCSACGRKRVRCKRGHLENHAGPDPRRCATVCQGSGSSAARQLEPNS